MECAALTFPAKAVMRCPEELRIIPPIPVWAANVFNDPSKLSFTESGGGGSQMCGGRSGMGPDMGTKLERFCSKIAKFFCT